MTVTRLRVEMGQWEYPHWEALVQLRKERADRKERRAERRRRRRSR